MNKSEKPIYKQWWFWVIIVVVLGVIGIFVPKTENTTKDNQETAKVQQEEPKKVTSADDPTYSGPYYEIEYDSVAGQKRVDVLVTIDRNASGYKDQIKAVFTNLSKTYDQPDKIIYLYDEYKDSDDNRLVANWSDGGLTYYAVDWNMHNHKVEYENGWKP